MNLLTVSLVVVALYFGRDLFIPLALAVLFSFVLSPMVNGLEKLRMGRLVSVFIAVIVAFALMGLAGTFVASQTGDLARKLPEYQQNIHKKVESLGKLKGASGRLFQSLENLRSSVTPHSAATQASSTNAPTAAQGQAQKPVPVEEVGSSQMLPLRIISTIVGSLFNILATAFIVIVFVFFMLNGREDLRKRLIKFIGDEDHDATAQLLDDAAARVSRYLVMQLIVNICYGVLIGVGLLFIGVPNPLLWGALSALLRYIPYAGAWIAMLLPFSLGMAIDPGWTKPLLVFGMFAVIEIIVANVAEPWIYGTSTGITPLAVLIAAVFWTWIWGPVGLLLSTPLTVCLISIGRYIPNMKFLVILFADEPRSAPVRHQIKGKSTSEALAR